VQQILKVKGPRGKIRHAVEGHLRIFLKVGQQLFEQVRGNSAHGNRFHGLGSATCGLERSVSHKSLVFPS
jgi:hypothetical protein